MSDDPFLVWCRGDSFRIDRQAFTPCDDCEWWGALSDAPAYVARSDMTVPVDGQRRRDLKHAREVAE